jgi:hypothetical protein
MSALLRPNRTYNFDFSGKGVTVNGMTQDLAGLCYLLGYIDYSAAIALLKCKPSYNQIADELHTQLCQHDFSNITFNSPQN